MTDRIANKDARVYVQSGDPFIGSNTFAEWVNSGGGASRYVVYSYGDHWPLFIFEEGKWYENAEKRSVTTSKHRTQLHPLCETEKQSAKAMREIANLGTAGWMRRKLAA